MPRSPSARRPGHEPSSKEVDVEVVYTLTPIRSGIGHQPVPSLVEPEIRGHGGGEPE